MVPRERDHRPSPILFGAAGWLFADLLLALAVIFLVANSVGQVTVPIPTPTVYLQPTPTSTPSICGIDQNPGFSKILTVSNDAGLRANTPSAQAAFATQVQKALRSDSKRTAGLVEVYGGGMGNLDVSGGIQLANGAITVLKMLGDNGFIFTAHGTPFQSFWNGTLNSNQIRLMIFFFRTSSRGTGCTTN